MVIDMTRRTATTSNRPGSRRTEVLPEGWACDGPAVPATRVDQPRRWLFTGAVGPLDEHGQVLHELDVTAQVALTVENLQCVLGAADMGLADVLRVAISTVDLPAMSAEVDLLGERFAEEGARPALTLVGVAALPFPGALLVLDAVAAA